MTERLKNVNLEQNKQFDFQSFEDISSKAKTIATPQLPPQRTFQQSKFASGCDSLTYRTKPYVYTENFKP